MPERHLQEVCTVCELNLKERVLPMCDSFYLFG